MNKESDTPTPEGQFLVFQTEDGKLKIDVRFEGETVWLTHYHRAELFQTSKQNVGQHLKSIFIEGELVENSVVKESFTTAADGKRYATRFHNLDADHIGRLPGEERSGHPVSHLGHPRSAWVHREGFCPYGQPTAGQTAGECRMKAKPIDTPPYWRAKLHPMSNYQVVVTCIEVITATTRENSIVSGGGGGGYVSSSATSTRLYVDPVHISTSIQRTSEIWGKQPNGQESRFLIPGADLPIRQGHKLALLVGNGAVWAVRNFSTGATNWMVDASAFSGSKPRQVSGPLAAAVGIVTAICSWAIYNIPSWLSPFGPSHRDAYHTLCLITGYMAMGLVGALVFWFNRRKHYNKQWADSKASWDAYLLQCAGQLDSTEFR